MSSGVAEGIRISAIACSVPNNSVANDHFVSLLGTEQMAKFEKMVGVVQRRLAPDGMTTSSLAISAGRKLIEDGSFRPDTIDAVLFVSQTPDYVLPATACVVQSELGVGKSAIAFDINLGCSGFTYGVFVAASLLKMEGVSKVLLCGGDVLSKIVDPADAASAPLFGDAGFAAVVGVATIMAAALAIVPITREVIYQIYNFRGKLADNLEIQANFLELNKTCVENNTMMDAKRRSKVIEKQTNIAKKLRKLSDTVRVKAASSILDTKRELKKDNSHLSIDNIKDEISNSPFELL